MKILIIGGGIGGLAAAGFFEQKGFDATLIERAPEWKHIGFGLSLWENGRGLLEKLGVDKKVADEGYEMPWMELADKTGRTLFSRDILDFEGRRDKPVIIVERTILHDALVKNLKTTEVRLGTTVKELKNEKDKAHVKFSDGTQHAFDLVVAADGVNSQVRENIFGPRQSRFYGWSVRSFWVPEHIPVARGSFFLSKEKITMGMFPINKKCFVVMYEYNPKRIDHPPLRIEDFLPYLTKRGWTEDHVRYLIKEAHEGRQYYDHLRRIKLGPWHRNRVALLGDARHGFSPIAGMGANMAIEDGFVLAEELAKVEPGGIDLALQKYAKRRTARLVKVTVMNEFSEKVYFIKSRFGRIVRDNLARMVPRNLVGRKLREVLSDPI